MKRGPNPHIQVQSRDIDLLKALLACRYLSTSQIQRAFFGQNRSVVCHRLNKKLLPQKIVARHYPAVRFANSEAVYSLGQDGVTILAKELGVTAKEITRPTERAGNPVFLQHMLEINETWLAVRTACVRSHGACELISWWTEHKIRKRLQRPGGNSDTPLPDSRFSLQYADGSKGHFFLEVDRGTERLGILHQKVQAYLAYYLSDRSEADYGFKKFRVLTVVPDQARLAKALRAAAEAGANNLFLFGVKQDITAECMLTEIWVTPRDFFEVSKDGNGAILVKEKTTNESIRKRYSLA